MSYEVMSPKDAGRLERSTSKAIVRASKCWVTLLQHPRQTSGNVELIKKYNLIEVI